MKHDFCDGKYTVIFDGSRLHALRYGEDWRDLVGDGLVLSMLQEVDRLKTRLRFALNLWARHPDIVGWQVRVMEVYAEDVQTAMAMLRPTILDLKQHGYFDIFVQPQNEEGREFEEIRCVDYADVKLEEGERMKGMRQRRKERLE